MQCDRGPGKLEGQTLRYAFRTALGAIIVLLSLVGLSIGMHA